MNSDHHYMIGESHEVCQDYAASLNGFAALSDGCSVVLDRSGKPMNAHTDIGARLLVRAAFHHQNHRELVDTQHRLILHTADGYRRQLDLPIESLSATLLTLIDSGSALRATICGDGVIAARQRDGQWKVYQFVYPLRPYYLRYILCSDPWRDPPTEYVRNEDGETASVSCCIAERSFSKELHDLVIAMSDGSSSFTKDNRPVEFTRELSARLLDFRRMKGRFVLRHLSGVMRELAQDGIVHQDDISLIAIHND